MAVSLRSNCRFGLPDADGGNWWAHASTPTAHGPTRHAWSTLATTLLNNEARQELAPTELDPAGISHRAVQRRSSAPRQAIELRLLRTRLCPGSALALPQALPARVDGCINPGGVRSGERGIQLGATHAARSSIRLDAVSIGRLMTGAARRSAMSPPRPGPRSRIPDR
jgi:hypothetical protein